MKVLIIHQHFCTPRGGGALRGYEFARFWTQSGCDVTILCGGTDTEMEHNGLKTIDGLKVIRQNVDYGPDYGFVRRCMKFVKFALDSCRSALTTESYDLVYATSTPLTVAIPALVLKFVKKTPYVLEVRDVWPDAIFPTVNWRVKLLLKPMRILEWLAYKFASDIVVLSPGMRDRLIVRKGVHSERITTIPNGCDLDRYESIYERRLTRIKSRVGAGARPLKLIYIGSVNKVNDLDFLLEMFTRFSDGNDYQWTFIGDGHGLKLLRKKTEEREIGNVDFRGYVVKEKCTESLVEADVGLVSFLDSPVYYENSPNKYFDYISAGVPVIFNRSTWLKGMIDEYKVGIVCEKNGKLETIESYLRTLMLDAGVLVQASRDARELAETHFDRKKLAAKALNVCIHAKSV